MMRLENDSRGRGLLSAQMPYSTLEMSTRSEFDIPMSSRRQSNKRGKCCLASFCIALILVAAIVSASVVGTKKDKVKSGDGSSSSDISGRQEHDKLAPTPAPALAPSPAPVPVPAPAPTPSNSHKFPNASPPSPPSDAPVDAPVIAPVIAPAASAPVPAEAYGPSSYPGEVPYESICEKTTDPKACLAIFATNPNARKVDLQQWTIMTMEAANTAVNESYTLTKSMEKANFGNDALNQCLEVFADSLDQLNTSMYLVADMNLHAPGNTGVDVQTFMSAAMTDQDTCLQGISEVGGWPGSDAISGARADRVNTLLSISLSFVDALTKSLVDPNHHRRLLEIELQQEVALGRRGGLRSFQTLQRLGELVRKL